MHCPHPRASMSPRRHHLYSMPFSKGILTVGAPPSEIQSMERVRVKVGNGLRRKFGFLIIVTRWPVRTTELNFFAV